MESNHKMTEQSKIFEIALCRLPGISNQVIKRLIEKTGSAEILMSMTAMDWVEKFGIKSRKLYEALSSPKETLIKAAEEEIDKGMKLGVDIVFFTHEHYPKRLRELPDAPALLYVKGKNIAHYPKSIAIVGTRKSTEYGNRVTNEIIEGLSSYKPLIVSGLAYGIDIVAHKAALKHGLDTVAVLANSLDTVYPAAHKDTAKQIVQQGALVSENRFGTTPLKTMFPARNRIISGLADAVIIVEAAESGGALISAEMANDYNKEVFAVPGTIGQKYSEGCNALIKNHKAQIYTSPYDVVEALNWDVVKKQKPEQSAKKVIDLSGLGDVELKVVQALQQADLLHIDELGWQTGIAQSLLSSTLLTLEFEGLVVSLPGKKFKLVGSL